MTIENWLTVAIIVTNIMLVAATLCTVLFADWIKSRINQPKPNPEIKQPNSWIQRLGAVFKSRWYRVGSLLFLFVSNTFLLFVQLNTNELVTSRSVAFTIFLCVTPIFNLLAIRIEQIQEQLDHNRDCMKLQDQINGLFIQLLITDEIGFVENVATAPIAELITAIKELLGLKISN